MAGRAKKNTHTGCESWASVPWTEVQFLCSSLVCSDALQHTHTLYYKRLPQRACVCSISEAVLDIACAPPYHTAVTVVLIFLVVSYGLVSGH